MSQLGLHEQPAALLFVEIEYSHGLSLGRFTAPGFDNA
jgi:hypothetical protein